MAAREYRWILPIKDKLPGAIYEQRKEALRKHEADVADAKEAIESAYQEGLMSDEEYQAALTEAREGIEAQFEDLRRREVERGIGIGVGAMRGGMRRMEMDRMGELGRRRRAIGFERARRGAEAGRFRAGALADLISRREIPRLQLPEAFGRREMYEAITGRRQVARRDRWGGRNRGRVTRRLVINRR